MPVGLLRPLPPADRRVARDRADARGRVLVVEQRIDAAKALLAEKFLGIQAAIRRAELRVSLVRYLTEALV